MEPQENPNQECKLTKTDAKLKTITLIKTLEMNSDDATALYWIDNETFLCSRLGCVEKRSVPTLEVLQSILVNGHCLSACYTDNGRLVTKIRDDKTVAIYIGTDDDPMQKTITEVIELEKYNKDKYYRMAVGGDKIFDLAYGYGELRVYSLAGSHLYDVMLDNNLGDPLDILYLEEDNSVVITDVGGCGLWKYQLDHELKTGELVRKSGCFGRDHVNRNKCIVDPTGVTADNDGNLYSAACCEGKIAQLTKEGKLNNLNMLQHKHFNELKHAKHQYWP